MSYAYDVFGATRSQSGTTANDYRFTGQQNDQNADRGLYYLRARMYDPSLGRFLQKDPLPFVQRYVYVEDNPENVIDPIGLCGWSISPSNAADCAKKGAKATAHAVESSVGAVASAAQYCASSSHLLECYERGEVASIGIAVTEFGFTIGVGGCAVIAPIVGAATAIVGGVATCGLAVVAGGIVVSGGVILTYHAFTPWHEAPDVPSTGVPSKASNKEQRVTQ